MRKTLALLAALALALTFPIGLFAGSSSPTPGVQTIVPQNGLMPTNTVETCGPVSATLNAAGQSLSLPFSTCPGVANYLITIKTTSGQSALAGTITSTDSTTGGSRRFIKTGVGNTQVSIEALPGTQGALEYRTVGGGYGQTITLSAYTSGSADVTILGLYNTTSMFINGAVDDREDVASRQGRLYTATTGLQSVSAGNFLSLQMAIPSGANYRAFIVSRVIDCNNTGTTVLQFNGTSNPTTNLATTTATVTNRGNTGGPVSSAALTYVMGATHPDQNPAATNPAGGFINPSSHPAVLGKEYMRTVSPGQSFVNWIGGSGGGLAASASCYITYLWYEENVN